MRKLLYKEFRLSASKLTFFFILFGLIAMLPGYPVLVGAFFVSFGIFQSVQKAREDNDIVYSALLPVAKADVVRSKFAFAGAVELCGFLLMAASVLVRMTVLRDAAFYRNNALMNANPAFLGFALVIFGCFNAVFLGGFFKTAYAYGKPFLCFIVVTFLVIAAGETLHHIPGLEAVNAFGFEHAGVQLAVLLSGAAVFALLTFLSLRVSIRRFEQIDL